LRTLVFCPFSQPTQPRQAALALKIPEFRRGALEKLNRV